MSTRVPAPYVTAGSFELTLTLRCRQRLQPVLKRPGKTIIDVAQHFTGSWVRSSGLEAYGLRGSRVVVR